MYVIVTFRGVASKGNNGHSTNCRNWQIVYDSKMAERVNSYINDLSK